MKEWEINKPLVLCGQYDGFTENHIDEKRKVTVTEPGVSKNRPGENRLVQWSSSKNLDR